MPSSPTHRVDPVSFLEVPTLNSSEPPLRIRRADLADLDALVVLEQTAFAHDRVSRAQYRRHLDSDSVRITVATLNHQLLGAAVLFFRRGARVARLYSLAITSEARGLGIGSALLQAAEQTARQRRCHTLRLEVRTDNAGALALYERAGYARRDRRASYYEDGSDAWRFQKRLDPDPVTR